MKKFLAPLCLLVFALSGCEKDDICDGGASSTPRVVIEFFDIDDPSLSKNVVDLMVVGEGQEQPILFNPDAADEDKYRANTNKIALPLKTTEGQTKYVFTYNADTPGLSRTDTIAFNYATTEVYVSRACGFRKEFDFLPGLPGQARPVELNNNPNIEPGAWIQDIRVVQYHVENETETHVHVMF